MNLNKVTPLDVQKQMKANQLEGYQKALEHDRHQEAAKTVAQSGIRWNITKTKDNEMQANPLLDVDHVTISSIRKFDKTISAQIIAHKLGYKISLEDRKEILIDKYLKNFLQSKSHNFIVAKFAELKAAFLGQLLTNIGVTIPELQKMQKKALKGAEEENELLYEENEYNSEMICILGGSGKKLKKELKIMDEIRTQLETQMANLGKPEHYSQEKIINGKLKVCKRIRDEFMKEKDLLEYQRDYFYLNKDKIKTKETNILEKP